MALIPYTPTENDASYPTWTPPLLAGFRNYVAEVAHRLTAKFFGKPVCDQILKIMSLMNAGVVSRTVINKTGSSIAAGKLVRISGYDTTSGKLKIVLADKDTGAAEYITTAAIANDAQGTVYKSAEGSGIDTSAFSAVGATVYLGDDGGIATSGAQPVGVVKTVHATTGTISYFIRDTPGTTELSLASPFLSTFKIKRAEEEITLANAAFTDGSAGFIPANVWVLGWVARVTTLLPNARTWSGGDAADTQRFVPTGKSGALGTTAHMFKDAGLSPYMNDTAAAVRITTSAADAGGGKIRVTLWYAEITEPTS
jgi:hypothetical protein